MQALTLRSLLRLPHPTLCFYVNRKNVGPTLCLATKLGTVTVEEKENKCRERPIVTKIMNMKTCSASCPKIYSGSCNLLASCLREKIPTFPGFVGANRVGAFPVDHGEAAGG